MVDFDQTTPRYAGGPKDGEIYQPDSDEQQVVDILGWPDGIQEPDPDCPGLMHCYVLNDHGNYLYTGTKQE